MLNLRTLVPITVAAAFLLIGAAPALAHPHIVSPSGQVIARGQNHPRFINGLACVSYGPAVTVPAVPVGPAWFGLETAHHGPDAGTPGRADECYQTTGSVPPGEDIASPVIR